MLGDDIVASLPALRAHAESLMTDMVRISAWGAPVFDPGTGATTRPETVIYEGIGKVTPELDPQVLEVAADVVVSQRFTVSVPVQVSGLMRGHVVTVTAGDALQDPVLAAEPLVVRSVQYGTHVTQRRLMVSRQQQEA